MELPAVVQEGAQAAEGVGVTGQSGSTIQRHGFLLASLDAVLLAPWGVKGWVWG